MDSLNGKQASLGAGVRRQGSRLRRQRSQEWQDPYSSSDNEDEPAFEQPPGPHMHHHHHHGHPHHNSGIHHHQYEDPRNVIDHRAIGRGRGSNSVKGSLAHGSMELITGPRGYPAAAVPLGCPNGPGGGSGSDGEGYSQPPPKYPGYGGSLPRNNNNNSGAAVVLAKNSSGSTTAGSGRNGGSRGRLSLRRGPSSSSTSDNNSDATYTDSEMPLHRRGTGQALASQSLGQSRESSEYRCYASLLSP